MTWMANKDGFVANLFLNQNEHGTRKKSDNDDYYLADYRFVHESPIPLSPANEWECALTAVSLPTDRVCIFGNTDDFFTVSFKSGQKDVVEIRVPIKHFADYDLNDDVAAFVTAEFKNNAKIRYWFRTDYKDMFKMTYRDGRFRVLFTTTQYRECVLDMSLQMKMKLGFSRNDEFPRPSNLDVVVAVSSQDVRFNAHFVMISIPSLIGPDTLVNQNHMSSMACIPLANPTQVQQRPAASGQVRFDVFFTIASPVYHRITSSNLTEWRAQILCAPDMNIAKWGVRSDGLLMLCFHFRRRALFRTC